MKRITRIPAIAASTALLLFGLSGNVLADGGRYYRGDHDHGWSSHEHSRTYRLYHDRHDARPHRKYKRRHRDNDEELLVGLLVGGLFGYALGNAHHPDRVQYDSYPPASALPPPAPPSYPVTRYDDSFRHDTCLQEREYQTTVTVGGRQVPAYGTACLQPDGSWRRDPAQVATY